MLCCDAVVCGVTQLHDVVYIARRKSSIILRFNATTHKPLTWINTFTQGLFEPEDIVACEQTSQLYVSDSDEWRVWRMSADGSGIQLWWPRYQGETVKPTSLSLTSTRLLLTSRDTNQLIQLDSLGVELRRVQLPDHMKPWHAVESPTTTFILSQENTQLNQCHISEVNTDGQVLRQFTGSRLSPLGLTPHIAIDSRGNLLVANSLNRCILLLDAQLKLRRVIIDEHQLNYKQPRRLCYSESTGQLLIGFYDEKVAVFHVLCR